jgi:hypothetical protein
MKTLKAALAAATLALTSTASFAELNWNLTYTPSTSVEAQNAFATAANYWSAALKDNITINLTLGLEALPSTVLASTISTPAMVTYSSLRGALATDAKSMADMQAVSSLSNSPSFDMLINRTSDSPNGSGSATPYLDNNASANNRTINLSSANMKALGLTSATDATPDGFVTFSNLFASSYDYNREDGIDASKIDFIGAAIHEIGHALGFLSGVDVLDACSDSRVNCEGGPNQPPFSENDFVFVQPLDLFRYSGASTSSGVIDFSADTRDKYFSLDKGVTSLASFSTGTYFGDGNQASHWKDGQALGILDPTLNFGELGSISDLDKLAFDVMGWDLATAPIVVVTPVPEPSSYALMGLGLAALGWCARRRSTKVK